MEEGHRRLTGGRPSSRRDSSEGTPWGALAVFYGIAVLVAAPFNLGLVGLWLPGALADTPLATRAFLLAAAGPALGVLAARRIDRRTVRRTTILGADTRLSTLTAVVPLVAFATVGGIGWLLPTVALIYALGEEVGWRGYLTDALHRYAPSVRYSLVALAWWPWHLRFETPFDWFVFPWIVFASSWVLGHAARESGSVLVAAAMHATVMLLTMSGPPSRSLLLAGGLALGGWILLGWLFPNQRARGTEA